MIQGMTWPAAVQRVATDLDGLLVWYVRDRRRQNRLVLAVHSRAPPVFRVVIFFQHRIQAGAGEHESGMYKPVQVLCRRFDLCLLQRGWGGFRNQLGTCTEELCFVREGKQAVKVKENSANSTQGKHNLSILTRRFIHPAKLICQPKHGSETFTEQCFGSYRSISRIISRASL